MYFVDSGRPLPGAPPLLKTRSHMRRNEARELWLKLKAQGWKQVAPPVGRRCRCLSWGHQVAGSNPVAQLGFIGIGLSGCGQIAVE